MDDLIAFLNARLDDDYQVARLATPGPWRFGDWSATYGTVEQARTVIERSPDHGRFPAVRRGDVEADLVLQLEDLEYDEAQQLNAAHILRQHPTRVLADVAAKRLIIEEWEAARTKHQVADVYPERTPTVPMGVLAWVMKALATAYADHPDYREEWRPE